MRSQASFANRQSDRRDGDLLDPAFTKRNDRKMCRLVNQYGTYARNDRSVVAEKEHKGVEQVGERGNMEFHAFILCSTRLS